MPPGYPVFNGLEVGHIKYELSARAMAYTGPLIRPPTLCGDDAPAEPSAFHFDRPHLSSCSLETASSDTRSEPCEVAHIVERKRATSKKPRTIHSLAQAGDADGVLDILQKDPACVNQRNVVMSHTPLHAAAASDQFEVLKVLLEVGEEDGDEGTVADLEARNMFGETPLHLAAKSASACVVRVLLDQGASTEARSTNGMTPLHLATWTAVRTHDTSVVEALLEHNAEVAALDKEEKTALCHLPQTAQCQRLRDMLEKHGTHQRMLKMQAQEAASSSRFKLERLEEELSTLVGLQDLKLQLRKWAKGMLLDQRRRALGLGVSPRKLPHMAFIGSPGTGKTTVARLLARLLHMVGVLAEPKVVEVQRTDLVGEFVGHTGPKTRRKINEAEGGILFVDEAYRLMPASKDGENDYGAEALEEIMAVMDSGRVVVIFAGYAEPMRRVFSVNEGFRRRITKTFTFSDLSPTEIGALILLKMEKSDENSPLHGFCLANECTLEAVAALVETYTSPEQRSERNGGLALPLLCDARDYLDYRLDIDCFEPTELLTIELRDLAAALHLVSQ